MRICVISPGVVHAVPRTVAIARHLEDVHFVDMPGNADRASLEAAGVKYHLPGEGGTSRIASLNLQRLLARVAPDVIVCHYGSGDHFFNAIAYGRCPVAVVAMGNDVLYDDGDARVSPMRRLLTRMGLRCAAFVTAKSKFLADALRRLGYEGGMDVNYWGSDLRRFRPGDRQQARRDLGLPEADPLVLSARAIEPLYNIPVIVEAFAGLSKRIPAARLAIIGRSTPEHLAPVEATVRRLGIEDRVMIPGEVGQEALPSWFCASDVVVSLADVEGFPNTVLEAMACAVPVVVGDIPQIRELLADGVNAQVRPIEAPAIAAAMLELLEDREKAGAIARRGRETALRAGDLDANGQRFAGALRELVGGARVPGAGALLRFRATFGVYLFLKRCFPHVS